MIENDLKENIKEFLKEAKKAEENKSYNSAATLFFKAIAVIVDLHILRKEGFIPSNHSQRFRLLEEKYKEIYKIMDKDFTIYQNSYKTRLNKEYVEVLKKDAEKISGITEIDINLKENQKRT